MCAQGGPVQTGERRRGDKAGEPRGRAGGAVAEVGNAWSRMSFTRFARLPPSRMMAISVPARADGKARMPRSRQMSAMTAPIGWRPTLAAICSGVGRCMRRAWLRPRAGAVAWRGRGASPGDEAPWGAASRWPALRRSLASSALARCRPREMRARISAMSAVPKQVYDGGGVGEGALADCGGEFACRSR